MVDIEVSRLQAAAERLPPGQLSDIDQAIKNSASANDGGTVTVPQSIVDRVQELVPPETDR